MSQARPELHGSIPPDRQPAFRRGIELFNRKEFFECHEVLEDIWRPARAPERLFLQALIHFAVGFYHQQRGNPVGAQRQLRKGLAKIERYPGDFLGVNAAELKRQVGRRLERIAAGRQVRTFPKIRLRANSAPAAAAPATVAIGG